MRGGIRATVVTAVALGALTFGAAGASAETVRVDADGVAGWSFNGDTRFATPYELSTDEAKIGAGSLHVPPIENVHGSPGSRDKFIAGLALGIPVADVASISFDFLMDLGAGAPANAHKHFYINLYTNLPGSTTFYDCRFDYVAASGSSTAFTEVAAASGSTATAVGDRAGDGFDCPATLGGMPAGATASAVSLNVGDTSFNDTGVGGYLDNVVIATSSGSTTYDFEATPMAKNDCKRGGWAAYGFTNQGLCIARSLELARL